MDNDKLIMDVNEVIDKLESIKGMLGDSDISYEKEMQFLALVFSKIFGNKVPYMLRVELINMYKKFYYSENSDSSGYYKFNLKDEKEFNYLCDLVVDSLFDEK